MIDKVQIGDTLRGEVIHKTGPPGYMVKGIVVNFTQETHEFIFIDDKKRGLSYVLDGKSKRTNHCRILLIERIIKNKNA